MVSDAEVRALIAMELNAHVGKTFIIKFLTSERGLQLNGKECVATGHNGERMEVKLTDDGSVMRLKLCNLYRKDMPRFPESSAQPIPDEEILRRLRNVLAHPTGELDIRDDTIARTKYVRQYVERGEVPAPSRCMDPMVPDNQLRDITHTMAVLRPCCARDDGMVDFRHFHEGCVGNGGTCPVCMEVTNPSQPAIGFPCGHVFHRKCAVPWLMRNNTCPTCRLQLGMPGHEYIEMFEYERRLTIRLNEWFISGMCERCQAIHQERNPLVVMPGNVLVPRDQLDQYM